MRYANEQLVRTLTSPVPDQDQPVGASLWATCTTWADAYDPAPSKSHPHNRGQGGKGGDFTVRC